MNKKINTSSPTLLTEAVHSLDFSSKNLNESCEAPSIRFSPLEAGEGSRTPLLHLGEGPSIARGGEVILFTFLFLFFLIPNMSEAYTCGMTTSGGDRAWATAATWFDCGGGIPATGDDVIATSTSGASTIAASITVKSLDMTGYANTLTHNASVTLTISGGSGSVFTLASGMTYTLGSVTTSAITFTGTTATTTITTAGKTMGDITFNGVGGGWQLLDSLTNGWQSLITLTKGSLDTNGQTITTGYFVSNNNNTRVLTFGASNIIIGYSFNLNTAAAGLSFNAGTSVITLNGSTNNSTYFWGGTSKTFNNVVFTNSGSASVEASSNTFANLTRTGTAIKTGSLYFGANQTITGTFTVNGNSSTDRVLIYSDTLGTPRTITAANTSFSNVDFRDITGAGAGSWDLSAITGLSGDAGGNSGITFTASTTNYWVGGTGSWSTKAEWANASGGTADTGRVPLPQDDVVFDNGSFSGAQTVTSDMPRLGRDIDFSAYNEASTAVLSWATTASIYGSFTFSNNMNDGYGASSDILFYGRGSHTITSAGEQWGNGGGIGIYAYGGTYTLLDALPYAAYLNLANGTFDADIYSVTAQYFTSNNSNTRTLNMGSGTWTATINYTATAWNFSTITNLTLNEETSTIVISNTGTSVKTFAGGGGTYNIVKFSGDNITVTGSNTISGTLALSNAGMGIGVKFTAGTTQYVNNFTSNGSVGSLTAASSTATSVATIHKFGGGTICLDYMNIDYIVGSPSNTWYMGANSTNGGNNNQLYFTGCPSAPTPNTGARTTSTPNEKVWGGFKVRGGVKFR